MPLERKVAWAFLIGAPALGLVMWGLAQNGFHWPWQIIYLAIIAGGLGLVVAAILWCHIGWVWLRKMGLQMGPAVVIVIGLLIVSGGAIWGAATWVKSGINNATPPSVLLLPEPSRLVLYNRGNSDLKLWGDKLEGTPADLENEARIIPANGNYYFLNDTLKAWALTVVGADGGHLFHFEVYLSDQDDRHYIARFALLIKMTGGNMEVHTQQLGVSEGTWESATEYGLALRRQKVMLTTQRISRCVR